MTMVQDYIVTQDEAGIRLDRWLRQYYPLTSLARLNKAIRKGEIKLDNKKAEGNTRLAYGQTLRLPPLNPNPTKMSINGSGTAKRIDFELARNLKNSILYDDEQIMVINKPRGLAVQGGTSTAEHIDAALPALIEASPHSLYGAKGRLVHRLDKDTSGVLLIAKTATIAKILSEAFREREMEKLYWAICVGVPDPLEGSIVLRLMKENMGSHHGNERMVVNEEDGQYAHTDYKVLDYAAQRLSLLALMPQTGRTHQLRVHLEAIGTPILGDGKYGGYRSFLDDEEEAEYGDIKLHLHARTISLPSNLAMKAAGKSFTAPLPKEFADSLKNYGLNPK